MTLSNYKPNEKFLDNSGSRTGSGIHIHPTADIHPNVYFEGNITVGEYCQIDAGAIIIGDVSIGHHTVIRCNSTLRGTITIGNYVHIFDQVNIEGGRPGNIATTKNEVPDKAIVQDRCLIYHGTVMHGTQIGEGTVIGMRSCCDYNTRIGKGAILENGTATEVDQIIPDNCIAGGVPAALKLMGITDMQRAEVLGLVPDEWTKIMAYKLEERYRENKRLALRPKNISVDKTAFVHPTAILEGDIKVGAYTRIAAGSIIIGDVKIGDHVFIALNAVVKGSIKIGGLTNILDNSVVDSSRTPDVEVAMKEFFDHIDIGCKCLLSHGCAIRGTDMEEEGAVGVTGTCDYNTHIGKGSIIGNGSATQLNQVIPDNCYVEGIPAIIRKLGLTDQCRQDYFGLIPASWLESSLSEPDKKFDPGSISGKLNVDPTAFIHPTAWLEGNISVGSFTYINAGTIISGNVSIDHHSLLACNNSIRGTVEIGKYTNIYDQICIAGSSPEEKRDFVKSRGPGNAAVGDYCWINHGCIMHDTRVDDGGAVSLGAGCDYNTHIGTGAVLGNRSAANIDQYIPDNCMAIGVPSEIRSRFLSEKDRQDYFGVMPSAWTRFEAAENEKEIREIKNL